MHAQSHFVLMAAAVMHLLACTDRREPITRQHLQEQIASQSKGALALAGMTKTNGYDHERDGMKLYSLEWETTLSVLTNGWKAGWGDYRVFSARPNAFKAAVSGTSVKRLFEGGTVVLRGKSTLQNADRGWRVLESEVTSFELLQPYDIPAFLGTWRKERGSDAFRIEQTDDGSLVYTAGTFDSGNISWANTYSAEYADGGIKVKFAEGDATITRGSGNAVFYTEQDAFSKQSLRLVRVP